MSILFYCGLKKNSNISKSRKNIGDEAIKNFTLNMPNKSLYGEFYVAETHNGAVKIKENDNSLLVINGRYNQKKSLNPNMETEELLQNISGHYLIMRYKKGSGVSIITDPILAVPMYIYTDNEQVCVSNRLDWILILVEKKWEVSWRQIHCFVLNSGFAGQRTFINNIKLGYHGSIYTINNNLKLSSSLYWCPYKLKNKRLKESTSKNVADALYESVGTAMENHKRVAIPLTGGGDSRLILAAASRVDKKKIVTFTHGFEGSNHPDVKIAKELANTLSVPHNFIPSNDKLLKVLQKIEKDHQHNCILGGQGRHSFVYDMMMYDSINEENCDLEFKGITGSLFKSKWDVNDPTSQIKNEKTQFFEPYFEGKAKESLKDLDKFFHRVSYEDIGNSINEKDLFHLFIYVCKFSLRNSPRTFFQTENFNSINPFYDKKFIETYLSISPEKRTFSKIHLEAIEHLCPQLSKVTYFLNNKFYLYNNGKYERLSKKLIKEMGYKFILDRKSFSFKLKNALSTRFGIDLQKDKSHDPTEWEFMKPFIINKMEPLLETSKSLFPEELGSLTIEKLFNSKFFKSRIYRFYSILHLISKCKKQNVSFF